MFFNIIVLTAELKIFCAQIIELMSAWGPLIYVGCFAATLSSAVSAFVGAPRVLQALAKDRLFPYFHYFEVGWGANNDPLRGYFLVSLICFGCYMIGKKNSNFIY